VCIALVVTREGMPLGYEIFSGNRVDVTTVQRGRDHGGALRLAQRSGWMDRGMVSEDNVAWLQKTGRRYLLGASRAELKKWRQEPTETPVTKCAMASRSNSPSGPAVQRPTCSAARTTASRKRRP
jgi:transposase